MMQRSRTFAVATGGAVLLAAVSLACFAIPMYVIRPFRHQGAEELAVALWVKQVGFLVSAASALLCLGAVVFAWRSARHSLVRAGLALAALVAIGSAYLTRVNVYEQMFHHLDAPQFEPALTAKLDPDDMVLAVRMNGAARAYPIREIAYHHVVNDWAGGEPIVATY